MRVLVTGGAGYVGFSLVKRLADRSEVTSITIFDNLSRGNFAIFTSSDYGSTPVRFMRGELLDHHGLALALQDIDVVVHLAAKVTTPYADHEAHFYDQINHWGTANLAKAVEESAAKRIIYTSSVAVYGSTDAEVDEAYEPHPDSFYGISKLAGERQVARLAPDQGVWIVRSGNVYGFNPAFRIDAVINRFMFEAHTAGRITLIGDGQQSRAFIHVDKLAELLTSIVVDGCEPGTYDAVEHNLTVREVAEHVGALYPRLEHLTVSQDMAMRRIRVKLPCRIFAAFPPATVTFDEELMAFRDSFSF